MGEMQNFTLLHLGNNGFPVQCSLRPGELGSARSFAVRVPLFVACAVYVLARLLRPSASDAGRLLETKRRHDGESTSADSSGTIFSDPVKVIQLGKATTAFTYANIVAATSNFSDHAVIDAGEFGTVYKDVLPGGEEVTVKKFRDENINEGINII